MKSSFQTLAILAALTGVAAYAGEPALVSLSPASQTTAGATQTNYTAVVSDTDGAADLAGVNVLISDAFANSYFCWAFYSRADNSISVYRQGNWTTAQAGAAGPGLIGEQCTIDPAGVSATTSGNNLSATVPIVLTGGAGTYSIFLNAGTNDGINTGYQKMGAWTLQNSTTKLFSISISPAIGYLAINQTTTATVTITDDPGFSGTVDLSVLPLVNGAGFTATLDKTSITGSGTATLTIVTNSRTPPHNAKININASTQDQSVTNSVSYTYAIDNGPPTITLNSGGSTQISGSQSRPNFSIMDGSKTSTEIPGVNVLINSSLDGQHACWMWFDGSYVWLANDDATSWSGMVKDGPNNLENSQCKVTGQGTVIVTPNPGQTYVMGIAINLTMKAGFSGQKIVFARAANKSGYDSGYVQTGTWTVP